ncbi:MAG: hypothetical protein J6Y02_04775 [Pseudobutyrivibrio sp.]|nr:hypothetical protein [Pseudobutyrivibrio sp.]
MNSYQILLGKNSASVKKVYISLPKGIYDLKLQGIKGMQLDRNNYMYAFAHGLKDLINLSIVDVVPKPVVNKEAKGIKLVSAIKKEAKETKKEINEAPRSPVVENVPEEPVVEESIVEEAIIEETPSEEQPKKKSKKKK